MQHFLIITCFAALAWATAPAALAQADLPSVESEAGPPTDSTEEITPPKPEEVLPNVQEPEEKDLPATEQEGSVKAGVRAALPLGDPVTILRLSVIPIFIWVIKNLISYSFLRRHVTRAIYVDIEYRMQFTKLCITAGRNWVSNFDPRMKRMPLLNISRENHHMYAALQSDIKECTWGSEVASVRLVYRSFDEIENIAERISRTFDEILVHSRDGARYISNFREYERVVRLRDQIEADLLRIEEIYSFWCGVGRRARCVTRRKKDKRSWEYIWIARSLFYSRAFWHSICVWVPLFIIVVAGTMLLFWAMLPEWGVKILFGALGVGAILQGILFWCCLRGQERRIKLLVLKWFGRRLEKFGNAKRPPTFV